MALAKRFWILRNDSRTLKPNKDGAVLNVQGHWYLILTIIRKWNYWRNRLSSEQKKSAREQTAEHEHRRLQRDNKAPSYGGKQNFVPIRAVDNIH